MPDIRLRELDAQNLVNYLVRQRSEVDRLIEALTTAPPAVPVAPAVPQPGKPDAAPEPGNPT